MEQQLIELAQRLGDTLVKHHLMVVTAESCTGGWVAEILTSVPGSSKWFERGFVTYSNLSKQEMLGVSVATLEQYGAVSEQTAIEMAEGALQHSHAQISLAITGIAGPGGAVLDKPVGTVCLAWAGLGVKTHTCTDIFKGQRQEIRRQAGIKARGGVEDVRSRWE